MASQNAPATVLPLEQLDLSIPDMDSVISEEAVKAALEGMPGIKAVRLISRGAWISYNPLGITKEVIIAQIRRIGLRASEFQAS